MNEETKRVEQRYLELGYKAADFQRAIKIQSQNWNNWKTRGIPKDKLTIISIVIGKSIDWILNGDEPTSTDKPLALPNPSYIHQHGTHKLEEEKNHYHQSHSITAVSNNETYLPFIRTLRLEPGREIAGKHASNAETLRFDNLALQRQGINPDTAVCLIVEGNSMEPVLPHGSTVGIDTSQTDVINGKMYAINHDGVLQIKILYQMPGGGLRLRSYNALEYPDEHWRDASHIRVLGKVFWSSVLW